MIDFRDLEKDLKDLKSKERTEINLKNQFKNSIFNMVNNIDNEIFLLKEFKNLEKTFNSDFFPDLPNPDLEAEFNSQKDNMKTNVNELTTLLKESRVKHSKAIDKCRGENKKLILRIEHLNDSIDKKRTKKTKEVIKNNKYLGCR